MYGDCASCVLWTPALRLPVGCHGARPHAWHASFPLQHVTACLDWRTVVGSLSFSMLPHGWTVVGGPVTQYADAWLGGTVDPTDDLISE